MQIGLQRESVLSVLLGAFVALAGIAVIVGMPWQYTGGGVAMVAIRALGSLLAAAVGVALVVVALRGRDVRNG